MLLRRTWLTAVTGFEDSFRTLYEDQALYAKLALRAPVLLTDEVWAHYRRHNNSVRAQMYGTADEAASRGVFLTWLAACTEIGRINKTCHHLSRLVANYSREAAYSLRVYSRADEVRPMRRLIVEGWG